MGKDASHSSSPANGPQDKSGTPTSLLISIVATIIVFAIAEIQNSLTLGESFAMRYTLMSYVALGLSLAFFWKRLEKSAFLKLSAGLYLFGLWVSLFMTTLAPVLLKGESPWMHGQVMQQFGLGFVALSGLALIGALFQGQKAAASVVLSALGAIALFVTSGAGFLMRGEGKHETLISAKSKSDHHGAKDEEGQEISASSHHDGNHGEPSNGLSARAPTKDGNVDGDHGEEVSEEHDSHANPEPRPLSEEASHETHDKDHDHKEVRAQKSPEPQASPSKKSKSSVRTASLEHALGHDDTHAKPEASAKEKGPRKDKAHHGKDAKAKGHEAHWSYAAGKESPEHWGELADQYRKCLVGAAQSPIDIPSAWPSMKDITLDYKLTPVSIVDNGHTIQFNVGEQNYARIAGKRYKLVQFHVHSPSEHWIDGRTSPLEIHFVHKDEKNSLAVIGVMVEQGKEQKVFGEMWGFVPQAVNKPASPRGKVFNIATLLPSKLNVYRYRGSLTTPPCSENVLWSVAAEKMTMSKEQIDAFRLRYKDNARPIQKFRGTAH